MVPSARVNFHPNRVGCSETIPSITSSVSYCVVARHRRHAGMRAEERAGNRERRPPEVCDPELRGLLERSIGRAEPEIGLPGGIEGIGEDMVAVKLAAEPALIADLLIVNVGDGAGDEEVADTDSQKVISPQRQVAGGLNGPGIDGVRRPGKAERPLGVRRVKPGGNRRDEVVHGAAAGQEHHQRDQRRYPKANHARSRAVE
jgi:hypothetical protein